MWPRNGRRGRVPAELAVETTVACCRGRDEWMVAGHVIADEASGGRGARSGERRRGRGHGMVATARMAAGLVVADETAGGWRGSIVDEAVGRKVTGLRS